MAFVGLQYVVGAPLKSDGKAYDKGFVIGKGINVTLTPNKNDVTLYADNGAAETDKTLRDITLSINVDDLDAPTYAKVLGHDVTGEAGSESVVLKNSDVAPFLGVGFIKNRIKNNVPTFCAVWLNKAQFSEPTDTADTKGESTNFQTSTIEGTSYNVEDGSFMEKHYFDTLDKAKAFLNEKAGITAA